MKIAIAGYGSEGAVNYRYWDKPEHDLVIVDERMLDDVALPLDANSMTGEGVFGRLNGFDMVVRSPGVALHKVVTDGTIWSATNEFFARCPAPIIGVTGTKGKGTTSSLVASILRAAGKTVHLVGNIGVPALEVLPEVAADDIVVYELSSFQLWDLKASPHVAVVLMVEPDHLTVHGNFADYIAAKAQITANQLTTDRVVYLADNEWSAKIAHQSVGQRVPYPSDRTVHVRDDFFYYQDVQLCGVDQLQLAGQHNIENACAAIAATWPWVQDGVVIAEGLRGFDGLAHRLKFVREVADVKYYDDSIATTPGSAIAAIRAFAEPTTLILGGQDKGADYKELIKLCQQTGTRVVAIGDIAGKIQALCTAYAVSCTEAASMVAAVRAAEQVTPDGGVVVLSPAAASFDMFENYIDRGEQFVAAVEALEGQVG